MHYILLDEIQLVDNFVALLNGFLRITNADTYVTGSNSKFLSSDIVTEFRGRGDEIRVYPLSFSEFSSAYNDNTKAWKDYYTYGGLPLILKQNNDEGKMDYLTTQTNNVYLNDVIERNNVQNKDELSSLVEIISSSIGSLTNPTKLYNTFKSKMNSTITDKTIRNYLDYLEEAFLIEKSNRYDVKGKKYIDTPLKYYFTDVGVRNSLLNFRQQEESHIMENIIYIELKRRGFNVDVGVVEVREKNDDDSTSRKQLEIDFIANKGNNKYYIQSALNIPTKEKVEQEQRSLLNVNDSFKKIIIVKDDIKRKRDDNGIITMGIFDFLLDIDSLDY
jgi:predicted AAA+ superfamily ATPase